jgi:hypothetical protein
MCTETASSVLLTNIFILWSLKFVHIKTPSCYSTENALHPLYTYQPINYVCSNNNCYSDTSKLYKAVYVHAIKAHRGGKGKAPIIHSFGAVCCQPHALATLSPGETAPQNPLNRRLAGPQSLSGCFGTEKNLLPMSGLESRTVQPVALSLYWLPYWAKYRAFKCYVTTVHSKFKSNTLVNRHTQFVARRRK